MSEKIDRTPHFANENQKLSFEFAVDRWKEINPEITISQRLINLIALSFIEAEKMANHSYNTATILRCITSTTKFVLDHRVDLEEIGDLQTIIII